MGRRWNQAVTPGKRVKKSSRGGVGLRPAGARTGRGRSTSRPAGRPGPPRSRSRAWAEVRPELVEKGRELVQDPAYPSPEVLGSVARLLTEHLSAEEARMVEENGCPPADSRTAPQG